jgi:hypothetical protein
MMQINTHKFEATMTMTQFNLRHKQMHFRHIMKGGQRCLLAEESCREATTTRICDEGESQSH